MMIGDREVIVSRYVGIQVVIPKASCQRIAVARALVSTYPGSQMSNRFE